MAVAAVVGRGPGRTLAAAVAVGQGPGRALAAVVAVGRPTVEEAGGGSGGGVAEAMLLELPAVMEKNRAPHRAAIIPLRSSSSGVAGEFSGVAGVYSGEEDPSPPKG